jgi:hypothetical protein
LIGPSFDADSALGSGSGADSKSQVTGVGTISSTGPLCKLSGSVPRARSPNNKSISSKLTCFVSLKKKKTTGSVTQMFQAAEIVSSVYLSK